MDNLDSLDPETIKAVLASIENSASLVFGRPVVVDAKTLTTTVDGQTAHFYDLAQSLSKLPASRWTDVALDRITELHAGLQAAHHIIHDARWPEAKKRLRVRIQASPPIGGFDLPASAQLSFTVVAEVQRSVVQVTPAMAVRWNVDAEQLWASGLHGNRRHLSVVQSTVNFGTCSAVALSGNLCTTGKLTCLRQALPGLPKHPVVSFPSSDTVLCYLNFDDLSPRQRAHHQEHLDRWKLSTRYGLSSNFFVWHNPLEVRPFVGDITNVFEISKK